MNGSSVPAAEACPAEIREILHAAACGEELAFEQGLVLASAEGSAQQALVAFADQLRRETVGDAITYVVNRNINFTNVCFVGCSFCGFGRGPGAADAYSLSLDEVVRRAREAWERGATEVCVQGGLPRDLDGFFYRDLLRAIKRAIPEMHVHAFSPMEIDYGVMKTGMPLRDYLQMMKDEGLGSIPGTAAEILDDRVRQELSPNKLPAARWVEIITAAHELGIPTTSTMMYGHVEEPADWVRHMLLLRSIQKRTGGFTEFVPLGFIHENTRLYRHGGARPGAKRDEHLRVHALGRVLLHGAIKNLQVSWVKLGFETSLACLRAGANDFSGTLMEENISKAAGATFGEYVSPEEFRVRIRSIGRVPAERTTTYKIRRIFDNAEHDPPTATPQLPIAPTQSRVTYTEGAY
ncbi:MAG: 7,8-didemethyl-8-hydroxy-5-deazariboflavin synthase subunit CofH [Acidobacteria bacterium]|nr:MAG: 7,8-didemethyl-8-hydroxy-5-deazariboflavin synthase subunit CofH [Acidobacteriota bacterium]PYT43871.1 MAG: 7,8-didemethyl-8-hydroxy-5-deazariboflavin synthase subunit CofH [Acidobacteriota bacterium]